MNTRISSSSSSSGCCGSVWVLWFSLGVVVQLFSLSLQYVDKRGKEGVITGARIVVATGNSPPLLLPLLLLSHSPPPFPPPSYPFPLLLSYSPTIALTLHTHTHHLQVAVLATQISQEPESMASRVTISSHFKRPQAKPLW